VSNKHDLPKCFCGADAPFRIDGYDVCADHWRMSPHYANLQIDAVDRISEAEPQVNMFAAHKERITTEGEMDFSRNPAGTLSDRINALINTALEDENAKQKPRDYLGGSRLGVECLRALSYEWHKVPVDDAPQFKGKTIRRFLMGHAQETETARWLQLAGFDLRTAKPNGDQYGFSVGPDDKRIAGHIDGVILEAPLKDYPHPLPWLWEHKIMAAKIWRECQDKGVKEAKPVYYAQLQVYMAYMQLNASLFTFFNTDTSELWFEPVAFDPQHAQWASDRGVTVVLSNNPREMPRISRDKNDFRCKWCDWKEQCWSAP
jgi:hypothetical protein